MSCPSQPGCQRLVSVAESAVQQQGQAPMDGNVGLACDHRQFRRVHEGHPAQVVQQFLVGDAHVSSVADGTPAGQQASVSDDNWVLGIV